MNQTELTESAIALLKELISIESFSKEEDKTADAIQAWLAIYDIPTERDGNNIKKCKPVSPSNLLGYVIVEFMTRFNHCYYLSFKLIEALNAFTNLSLMALR